MTVSTRTKCSKPKGSYCRIHNPAPVSFSSAEEALRKAEQDFKKKNTSNRKQVSVGFQKPGETRTLGEGVPKVLADHIALSAERLKHLTGLQRKALSGYTGFAAGVCNQVLMGKKYEYYDDAPLWKESVSGPCDFSTREDLEDYMETMDEILSPRQEEQRILYRGIPIYASLHDEIGAAVGKKLSYGDVDGLMEGLKEYYKPGKIFKYDTYLSTTHSADYAAERADEESGTKKTYWDEPAEARGIVFELKTNAGVDVTAVARHHAYEREVVLPRETYFKVVGVELKPEKYDTVSGYDDHSSPEELTGHTYTNLAVVVQMVEVDRNGKEITSSAPHKPATPVSNFVEQEA